MHSLPNKSVVRRFRLAAWMLLLKWVFVTGFLGLFGYAMWMDRMDLRYPALGLLIPALISSLFHWVLAIRTRCPLCFVPSFSHQQCAKHRKALHFFGSYRLFVALGVVFKGWFRCPYCGEPTAMQVRRRHPRQG